MGDNRFDGSFVQFVTGLLAAAAAVSLALLSNARPLLGVAGYIIFGGAVVVIQSQRDAAFASGARPQTPAEITLTLIGLTSAMVFPGLVAADGLGVFSWTPVSVGIALTVAVLYAIYGIVSVGHRLRGRPA
jgi:hypothetical protein